MSELVSISILNWNRKKEACRAINSAINQSYSNFEIVVIDNGSTDGSQEYIQGKFPQISFVQLDKNYGCPGGRNRGIPYCKGEFIFFCDNDGVLHENAVENAVNIINQNNNIAVVTGCVKDFDDESEIDLTFPLQKKANQETKLFQGGISLHRKSIYSIVGDYPDDYMYGGEETYLSYRIIDAGFEIVKSQEVILWHKKSGLARNIGKETTQMWGNVLMNAYQLFPLEYFLIYALYFLIRYPFYSIKHGFLKLYIKEFFTFPKRMASYERNPVKRATYKKIKKLN